MRTEELKLMTHYYQNAHAREKTKHTNMKQAPRNSISLFASGSVENITLVAEKSNSK